MDGAAKEALTFAPYPVPAFEAWEAAGAPPDVVSMFQHGARLGVDEEGVHGEVGQYPWPDPLAFRQCVTECDRALWVGAMEPVPDSEVARIEAGGRIHPWTIVNQGGGKWRACHDYSRITNGLVAPGRFRLPSPWDVAKVLKPDSYLAKYIYVMGFGRCQSTPTIATTCASDIPRAVGCCGRAGSRSGSIGRPSCSAE